MQNVTALREYGRFLGRPGDLSDIIPANSSSTFENSTVNTKIICVYRMAYRIVNPSSMAWLGGAISSSRMDVSRFHLGF